MFPKAKRLENKENIIFIQSFPCMVCKKSAPSEAHHWKSKGSGGSDHLNNLLSCCRLCHVEFHTIGAKSFWSKYGDKIRHNRRIFKVPALIVKGEWDG